MPLGLRLRRVLRLAGLAGALLAGACRRSPSGAGTSSVASAEPSARVAPPDPRVKAGAAHYAMYCALCHGREGEGYAADHAPSLVSATFLETASDEFLARGIRDGRPGTAMAPYARLRGGPLGEVEVAALLAFLRSKGSTRLALSAAPVAGDAARGEAVYEASCKRCHGSRTERGEALHLANPVLLSSANDLFLRYAVSNGRPGTPMEGFLGKLDAQAMDDVVAMLRSWAPPPPEPPPPPPPPEPPYEGPVVINPHGGAPTFTLREDRYVPADEVKAALDAKKRLVILDARPTSEWHISHIVGAVPVPYYKMDRLEELPKDGTWIIAYCACPHHASGSVVDELRRRGFKHTAVLDEGILEWQRRHYPSTGTPTPPPLPVFPRVVPASGDAGAPLPR